MMFKPLLTSKNPAFQKFLPLPTKNLASKNLHAILKTRIIKRKGANK